MKKVGILFGKEDTFPWALIDRINDLGAGKVEAEPVMIDKVEQGMQTGYDVIFDRISQDVPFYRAYLKNAALMGTAVINNPFWWSADEKFFNNCLMTQIGVPVPKTVLLPSKERPDDTGEKSFRNMKLPLDWEYIFDYIGFPAYMKPHSGGGWKSVYRVEDMHDLFQKHDETGQLVMMLQEEIQFDDYYRVYCIGRKYVKIMPYEPRNPHHLRYQTEPKTTGEDHKKLMEQITELTLKINNALGYDFNTVEFALRDGVPYAIDFCNPAPDADVHSVGQENFDWVVQHAAKYAIELAESHEPGKSNVTWGNFVKDAQEDKSAEAKPAAKRTRATTKAKTATSVAGATKSAAKPAAKAKAAKKPVARRTKKS
ncbi:MAG: hypothetical protein Q4F57_05080 [Weeksellaceae bacterium]|nr:hypothetical protein [Weeksellaceae bacterium]